MAGYDCKFVDQVGWEYKCKKCSLVAKKATLTDCCGETFCESCIVGTVDHKEPCPHCGQKQFQFFNQVRYQQHISSLQVLCSVKERGCEWTGRLDQLATHLDPDQNNCQFVDTSCPLSCGTVVPRKKLEEHVTKECVKREHFCQYCSFKASFEEIEGQHIPVCKYVPLQCPNRCGVTFEREDMEDHMKMCLLQEISCEFSSAGCKGRFNREDQEKHNRENVQKHLSILSHELQRYKEATEENRDRDMVKLMNAMETKSKDLKAHEEMLGAQKKELRLQEERFKDLTEKLKDLTKKLKVQEENPQESLNIVKIFLFLGTIIIAITVFQVFSHNHPSVEKKVDFVEKRIQKQWQNFTTIFRNKSSLLRKAIVQRRNEILALQHELEALNGNLQNLTAVTNQTQKNISILEYSLQKLSNRTLNFSMFRNGFVMRNFSAKRSAGGEWTSPAMYTHVGGYKFVFHVYANGTDRYPLGIYISYEVVSGEFDDNLEWPATIWLSAMPLDNSGDPENHASQSTMWERPSTEKSHKIFLKGKSCGTIDDVYYVCHSEVKNSLVHDNLSFIVFAMIL